MKNSATITLGKWHFKLGIISTYWDHFGYMAHFGIFKLTSLPKEGAMISKENYKGFWFRKVIRIRGLEISLTLPTRKDIIESIFWKFTIDSEGKPFAEREPSDFHKMLKWIFGRYFNPQ